MAADASRRMGDRILVLVDCHLARQALTLASGPSSAHPGMGTMPTANQPADGVWMLDIDRAEDWHRTPFTTRFVVAGFLSKASGASGTSLVCRGDCEKVVGSA